MSAFRFRLQKVLDLRAEHERDAAGRLAEARRDAEAAAHARALIEAVQAEGRQLLVAAHGNGGRVGTLQHLNYLLEQMRDRLAAADEVCRAADESLRARLADFQKAFVERRALAELRERHREQWRAEEASTERKRMDEIAITRHARIAALPGVNGSQFS